MHLPKLSADVLSFVVLMFVGPLGCSYGLMPKRKGSTLLASLMGALSSVVKKDYFYAREEERALNSI